MRNKIKNALHIKLGNYLVKRLPLEYLMEDKDVDRACKLNLRIVFYFYKKLW